MLKILIVDDSVRRVSILKLALENCEFSNHFETCYCDSADKGRQELLYEYDLLILDVLIPKKINATPMAKNSFELLLDMVDIKKSYIKPNLIIGLTADISELGNYRARFMDMASIVLDGSLNDHSWIDNIINNIGILIKTKTKSIKKNEEKLLITIHGIRTYGKWQSELSDEIKENTKSFKFIEVKYGFFDLISFAIPYLRRRKVKEISRRVFDLINENPGKEINIIAHSFGTLIAFETLKELPGDRVVEYVIFCASPLKSNENINSVLGKSKVLINECGTRDIVLLASKFLVFGLGDAGRMGFIYDNTQSFINRYHSGGHSLYFKKKKGEASFSMVHWSPIILYKNTIISIDNRNSYLGEDLIKLTCFLLEKSKAAFYFLIFVVLYFLMI